MFGKHRLMAATAAFTALLLAAPAWGASLNKSIKIAAGESSDGASSVNGSISVGAGAVVTGAVETVNGAIRIDANAQVEDAETVNGSVRIAEGVAAQDVSSVNGSVKLGLNVTVNGEVSVVNGKITTAAGTSVNNDISSVNGEIRLKGTEVGGNLSTVNGDVWLEDRSNLRGDLTVEKPKGWGSNKNRKPRVVIGPGSRVGGDLVLEHEVELFISETAEVGGVGGVMTLDDAVRFRGARP